MHVVLRTQYLAPNIPNIHNTLSDIDSLSFTKKTVIPKNERRRVPTNRRVFGVGSLIEAKLFLGGQGGVRIRWECAMVATYLTEGQHIQHNSNYLVLNEAPKY